MAVMAECMTVMTELMYDQETIMKPIETTSVDRVLWPLLQLTLEERCLLQRGLSMLRKIAEQEECPRISLALLALLLIVLDTEALVPDQGAVSESATDSELLELRKLVGLSSSQGNPPSAEPEALP